MHTYRGRAKWKRRDKRKESFELLQARCSYTPLKGASQMRKSTVPLFDRMKHGIDITPLFTVL
jgi:hypothetical protein